MRNCFPLPNTKLFFFFWQPVLSSHSPRMFHSVLAMLAFFACLRECLKGRPTGKLLRKGLTLARFVQYWMIIGPILGIFINKFPIFDQYWTILDQCKTPLKGSSFLWFPLNSTVEA